MFTKLRNVWLIMSKHLLDDCTFNEGIRITRICKYELPDSIYDSSCAFYWDMVNIAICLVKHSNSKMRSSVFLLIARLMMLFSKLIRSGYSYWKLLSWNLKTLHYPLFSFADYIYQQANFLTWYSCYVSNWQKYISLSYMAC